ncbi:MAG: M20/M25/M40 family metallo-hydrolase [Gemmatimonadetes bacterium]|nr:M20/M25/M40 family metallo-hydrolase [Gemmatimonadota bacterium]
MPARRDIKRLPNAATASFSAEISGKTDSLVQLCRRLVRARSENPPGDTSTVFALICRQLDAWGLDYKLFAPARGRQNLVARFDTGRPGPHLILHGHVDTFPAGDHSRWSVPPFSGQISNGRLFGRGVGDMKAGVTAALVAFAALFRHEKRLRGRATLTLVCDEETFGDYGARHLLKTVPDVTGDAMLSGEPGAVVRFGEKGFVWAECRFRTRGGHAAYPHLSANAIKQAADFISDVQTIERLPIAFPRDIRKHFREVSAAEDRLFGTGATDVAQRYIVNAGRINGGTKINMTAAHCSVEVDVRLPVCSETRPVLLALRRIARKHGGRVRIVNTTAPSLNDRHDPFFGLVRRVGRTVTGREPLFNIGLATSDARLWRYRGVPTANYGPRRYNIGSADEFVEIRDLLTVSRVHGLVALEYLAAGPATEG